MAVITNTIRFADNAKELAAHLQEGIGTLDVMKSAVDRTVQSLGGTGLFGAANKVAAAIQEMGGQLGVAGGLMKMTAAEQERANAVIEKAITKYDAMGIAAPQALRDIAAATKKAEDSTASFETKLSSAQSAAQTVGMGLTAALTAPLVGMGVAAIKSSIDFESAFAGVRKTVTGTPEQLNQINAAFREMAKTTPVSAVGLANIGEQAGQLGVSKDKIVGFTKTIVDISTATNLTADEAGSAFARLANVMKMPQEQFSNLGSAVVALGNFGASTEQEMLSMGQRIAAAGATAGMSVGQVLGIANALSSVGIEAESGGTAMSRVINKISMDVASGGGKLDTFAQIAGKSAQEFRTAWRDDAGVAFSDFMQGLAKAREHGGDELLGLMHELGFDANVRLVNAFMSAANAGDLMRDSINLGSKAFKENTEITRASEERYKTTANQLKILWNNLNDVALTIGEALTPMLNEAVVAIKPLVGFVGDLAKGFRDLPEPMQLTVLGVAGMMAALGPLLLVGSGVIGLILKITALLVAFPAIGAAAAVALEAVTTGMAGMALVAGGVIAAAGAVGTLAYALTRLVDVASGGKLSGWLTPFIAGSANAKLRSEEAAAGADAMALAFQRTGIKAKDAADALAINTEWLKKHNAELAVGTTAITKFSFEEQGAAGATQTLADKVKALTEEQRADILSKHAQHESIKAIAKETGIAADIITTFVGQQKDATKSANTWKKAMDDVTIAEGGLQGVLDDLNGTTVEAILYDLRHGATITEVARTYGVAAAQVRILEEEIKSEAAAAKQSASDQKAAAAVLDQMHRQTYQLAQKAEKDFRDEQQRLLKKSNDDTAKSLIDTGGIWREYYDTIAQYTLSDADYKKLKVQEWFDDEVDKLKDDDAAWGLHYDALYMRAQQKMDDITRLNDPFYQNQKDLQRRLLTDWNKFQSDIAGGFTQTFSVDIVNLLTGEGGFHEIWTDLWKLLKKDVSDILADLLNNVIQGFIQGAEQKLGNFLSGLGSGGGGSSWWKSLLGLVGGGGGGGGGSGDTPVVSGHFDDGGNWVTEPGGGGGGDPNGRGPGGGPGGHYEDGIWVVDFARGGMVPAMYAAMGRPIFSSRGTDTVPAMLTPGEGVLNTSAMRTLGVDGLNAMNNGGTFSTAALEGQIAGLRQELAHIISEQPRTIIRAVRDELQGRGRR